MSLLAPCPDANTLLLKGLNFQKPIKMCLLWVGSNTSGRRPPPLLDVPPSCLSTWRQLCQGLGGMCVEGGAALSFPTATVNLLRVWPSSLHLFCHYLLPPGGGSEDRLYWMAGSLGLPHCLTQPGLSSESGRFHCAIPDCPVCPHGLAWPGSQHPLKGRVCPLAPSPSFSCREHSRPPPILASARNLWCLGTACVNKSWRGQECYGIVPLAWGGAASSCGAIS